MEKVLLTGASGLLGCKLVPQLSHEYEVLPTHNTQAVHTDSIRMNIVDKDEVFDVLTEFSPDLVVHAAAETNVDKCETNRELAWSVNAEGTRNIALACAKTGSRLVYVSTDYVFDGNKGLYIEDDQPNPINYYGLTKLEGERFVRDLCESYVIARTCAVYGWHQKRLNFATWVIDSLKHGREMSVVEDHYDTPTLADELAEIIKMIMRSKVGGVYHTAGGERISRYAFALRIADTFGLDGSLVVPTKMEQVKAWIARRPGDSSLCTDKLLVEIGIQPSDLTRALRRMKENEKVAY